MKFFFALSLLLISVTQAGTAIKDYNLAVEAIGLGEFPKAIALLEPLDHGASANPAQMALIRLALGDAYLRTDRAEDAWMVLQKIGDTLEKTPQSTAKISLFADAARITGKREDARRGYEKASQSTADGVLARYAKARLYEMEAADEEQAGNFMAAAASYLAAGDAMLALGEENAAYLADARALFEIVAKGSPLAPPQAGWRGEATARAVFSTGEVERAKRHYPEAIAYYQRVFVSWPKYPQWAARAYLRAAECMEALGKRDFAIRHLREMLRKAEKFGALPEYEKARKQLRAWGGKIQ